jgi:hypothetical protein
MLKEHEIKEPARVKARRKWGNADVRKRVKQRQEKPKMVDPDAKPEVAGIISNEGRRDGRVNRFENKFKRDIRTMMEGQAQLNLQIYAIRLEQRHRKLLAEKLRRLKLAHNIGESNV